MLLHCDFVYATPGARFQMPFVPLGVVRSGLQFLLPRPRLQRAASSLASPAVQRREAARRGSFVTEIVPEENLPSTRAMPREAQSPVAALPPRLGAPHQAAV
jgi:enoyl-CoA hydratase/carnithine racemase